MFILDLTSTVYYLPDNHRFFGLYGAAPVRRSRAETDTSDVRVASASRDIRRRSRRSFAAPTPNVGRRIAALTVRGHGLSASHAQADAVGGCEFVCGRGVYRGEATVVRSVTSRRVA
jgi:hypothetical protein